MRDSGVPSRRHPTRGQGQFLLNGLIARPGGQTRLYGTQSRIGIVPAGKETNDSNQLLDQETGEVLADLGEWRLIRAEPERMWVGRFASRRTAQLVMGSSPRSPAYLGYIDLRPGASR